MAEQTVNVYTPNGTKVGYFKNPAVQMYPDHYYSITGEFFDTDGKLFGKIEFNPEAVPYHADLSGVTSCKHQQLVKVYVQKGRQPVNMTGICPNS